MSDRGKAFPDCLPLRSPSPVSGQPVLRREVSRARIILPSGRWFISTVSVIIFAIDCLLGRHSEHSIALSILGLDRNRIIRNSDIAARTVMGGYVKHQLYWDGLCPGRGAYGKRNLSLLVWVRHRIFCIFCLLVPSHLTYLSRRRRFRSVERVCLSRSRKSHRVGISELFADEAASH
jgi:hypothetical protein